MNPVDEVMLQIDSVPPVTCVKCEFSKHPCLFTPAQLERKRPICRMCCKKPRGGK